MPQRFAVLSSSFFQKVISEVTERIRPSPECYLGYRTMCRGYGKEEGAILSPSLECDISVRT